MSYARFGYDGSDVYVYLDISGYFTCCACALGAWRHDDTDAILEHLRKHRRAGHVVLDETFQEIERDRTENDSWLAGLRA